MNNEEREKIDQKLRELSEHLPFEISLYKRGSSAVVGPRVWYFGKHEYDYLFSEPRYLTAREVKAAVKMADLILKNIEKEK